MNQIGKIEKSYSYTIPDGPHKGEILWSGRYVAVSCVILAHEVVNDNECWFVLANKRGSGTPDDQGKWNMPCGYLDGGESATAACARETAEECGVYIASRLFKLINVETAPEKCNKGNVSLRHLCILSKRADILNKLKGGIGKFVSDYDFDTKISSITSFSAGYLCCDIGDYIYCPSNDNNNPLRKPNVGMLEAMCEGWHVSDKQEMLMIGDASGKPEDFSDSDKKCAENFGIDYIDVRDFLEL